MDKKKSLWNNNPLEHIAIIMDGNGRWAKLRGQTRIKGHEKGAETVREITRHCNDIGIKYLTLYAFSTENWKRPKLEVEFLFKLLGRYLTHERETYQANNIRFETIGDLTFFPKKLQEIITETKQITKNNTGLTQVIALNYGARNEIVRSIHKVLAENLPLTEESITTHLDTASFSPVELIIRTSGEIRLSNFLLWQAAYAELAFTDTLWPDFTPGELNSLIANYLTRDKRFGGVKE